MDKLVPCDSRASLHLVKTIGNTEQKRGSDYVARMFPSIMPDITRLLAENTTQDARDADDNDEAIRQQLKPFLAFSLLLGKCPQITSLMYRYFRASSFQPFPENLFSLDETKKNVQYRWAGITDKLLKEIIEAYIKYLIFDFSQFSSIWNWSELVRIVAEHPNAELRFLAASCISIIFRPTRDEHQRLILAACHQGYPTMIDLQIENSHIYENTFKLTVDAEAITRSEQFAQTVGYSHTGYTYCSDSFVKLSNVLLPKKELDTIDSPQKEMCSVELKNFIPVESFTEVMSKLAYSISINRPCLVRGPIGSGKSALLDYVAASTNRIQPPHYIKVQVCDQIDSRNLIGNYVTTEIPGQFEWQPGPLTQAIVEGSWIVFEDIGTASPDVVQVLRSVMDNGNVTCISTCPINITRPHSDFRILFTFQTNSKNNTNVIKFIQDSCDIIDIPVIPRQELIKIIEAKYQLNILSESVIKVFNIVNNYLNEESTRSQTRQINFRELFKLCRRLQFQSLRLKDGKIDTRTQELMLLDLVECFLAHQPNKDMIKLANMIGNELNLPINEVQKLLVSRGPKFINDDSFVEFGRVRMSKERTTDDLPVLNSSLAYTPKVSRLLEGVAQCVRLREPCLLVGETGVGKTSIVQHIADLTGHKLIVVNLSQQSDSADLLGGFKPVQMRDIMKPLHDSFEYLFKKTYELDCNGEFLKKLNSSFLTAKSLKDWAAYLRIIIKVTMRPKVTEVPKDLCESWSKLHRRTRHLSRQVSSRDEKVSLSLAFTDGTLLKAVKAGYWILLDEVNLAEPDVLQCLITIMDSLHRSTFYLQTPSNSLDQIKIHRSFRIFGCMNPSTDIGKRDLDTSIRARFTEFFVDDVTEQAELRQIAESYAKSFMQPSQIDKLVTFYREVRARSHLYSDNTGNSPVYSLRTLCRALVMSSHNLGPSMEKNLYEALRVTFLDQLDESSQLQVTKLLEQHLLSKKLLVELPAIVIPQPKDSRLISVEGYWIRQGSEIPYNDPKFILTDTVHKNLACLARVIFMSQRKLPVLIQGNTSVGKTSLVGYLAKLTGNTLRRINNHENTDLQEYLGRYAMQENGQLAFEEGLLVRAMRKGYWIILDELNLAPSELLEALNRVLDDNRELYVPEIQETVKAHPRFMLFATQNPPGEYAGRKYLSRAFRNRFAELHFADLPTNELEIIIQERCEMPRQYAKKMISVMRELQLRRRESGCFNGKQSFMTMRDLLRWGTRYQRFKDSFEGQCYEWEKLIAEEGLVLLEGRVRTKEEAETVKTIIEKVFKRELNRDMIYDLPNFPDSDLPEQFKHIYLSKEFKRLYVQMSKALKNDESVLLCGPTGCGKTTACQLYASLVGQRLRIYNCHMGTESSDFIGNIRPTRDNGSDNKQLFPWVDGPLVNSFRKGYLFLMDEISLADDAVLERINSVLEYPRTMILTEKAGDPVKLDENFRLLATMNPGGDYGKKELSPALRNRFTEIYCHNTIDIKQIISIICKSLKPSLLKPRYISKISKTMEIFLSNYYDRNDSISIRDILSWCHFINKATSASQPRPLTLQEAVINGASLVFFDQLGTCGFKNSISENDLSSKYKLKAYLNELVVKHIGKNEIFIDREENVNRSLKDYVQFKKFTISRGPNKIKPSDREEFVCECPTVMKNIIKIVRAMQLDRPILLEGDPGVGKTSIVQALAKLTGHEVVRINLSEQTDLNDLFGSDLPDTSDSNCEGPRFIWSDGPFLKAIKESKWVLLDEMNLASQSVLEGLNSCLDHRGEIYIPELEKKFIVKSKTRIFACQNPYSQGGARKGLPQSYLNRFTSIYMKAHTSDDLIAIIKKLYPGLPDPIPSNMVAFNNFVNSMTSQSGQEYNLRTIIYWCDLTTSCFKESLDEDLCRPDKFVQFAYLDGIRSSNIKADICDKYEEIFEIPVYDPPYREIRVGQSSLNINRSILRRNLRLRPHLTDLCVLKYQMPYMESICKAIEFGKMPILVGPSGVGKKSMIRIIAGLTGNVLNVMSANTEMDTIELLGSYEQRNLHRQILDIIYKAKEITLSICNSSNIGNSSWIQIFQHIWSCFYTIEPESPNYDSDDRLNDYRVQLIPIKDLLTKLKGVVNNTLEKEVDEVINRITLTLGRLNSDREFPSTSGNFDWIDSILLKSVREGSWLMIEDANLMNPATLDRLNSLVETNGYLTLNEKGAGPNGIETLVPHKDFKLILTMDPQNGELSRAMRNRGVEIFVQTPFYFEDFLLLINQNGFTPDENTSCMLYTITHTCYDIHKMITGLKAEEPDCGDLLTLFALNNMNNLAHQVRRGCDISKILSSLLVDFYRSHGHIDNVNPEHILRVVQESMARYGAEFKVKKSDERYNFLNFRQDLVKLTGGDAEVALVQRDNGLFFEQTRFETFLHPSEQLEFMDIVNTCTAAKVFIEISSRGDFVYRHGFIKSTFSEYPDILPTIAKQINNLSTECLPVLNSMMLKCKQVPVNEIPYDTRNFPDLHHILQCLDYQATKQNIDVQNRWLLSLQRVSLNMIVEFIEKRTNNDICSSLWLESERLKDGKISRDHLIRPSIEIVSDLYDLLSGILRFISNRSFNDIVIDKVIARSFWISYFICKLKRGYEQQELVAVSNQLPMLWALTYQKVIEPIVRECDIGHVKYRNRKFSNRIEQVTHFLEVNIKKTSRLEKTFFNKVINRCATSYKVCEKLSREVDRIFAKIVTKSENTPNEQKMEEMIAYSGLIWSNSEIIKCLYFIEEKLVNVAIEIRDNQHMTSAAEHFYKLALEALNDQTISIKSKQEELQTDMALQLMNKNRRFNGLDQFAPIWQHRMLMNLLTRFNQIESPKTQEYSRRIDEFLKSVNGIMISPRFYNIIISYLQQRYQLSEERFEVNPRQELDLFVNYLSNLLPELNVVFDHQLVNWTKLRSTTNDLSSIAPLLPEFSPIISLTASYSLDVNHLKLNAYMNSVGQLESILEYLVKSYKDYKLFSNDCHNDFMSMAADFHRLKNSANEEPNHTIDDYLTKQSPQLRDLIKLIQEHSPKLVDSIKLMYYGYLTSIEFAPIFTIDPAVKTREKLEVYKSELAHIKIDLYFKNTLCYWRTGENLALNEIETTSDYFNDLPYATKILIARKSKLEKSIAKLLLETYNRPKSDDGSLYFELRKTIEIDSQRVTENLKSLMQILGTYIKEEKLDTKSNKLDNVICLVRTMVKNLEKTISRYRLEYVLYTDIISYYLMGIGMMNQGLRQLFFSLEREKQLRDMMIPEARLQQISGLFSFINFNSNQFESVQNKIKHFNQLNTICRPEELNKHQSALLNSVLVELRHHIDMSPSDILRSMPIVEKIVNLYHQAWLARKQYIEDQLKEKEKTYQYKTQKNILGTDISIEKQEFLELCSRFPTYEHVYEEFMESTLTSVTEENLKTEKQVVNMNRSADLSLCNQICKSHYKLMMIASRSLIGARDDSDNEISNSVDDKSISSFISNNSVDQEMDTLFALIRNRITVLDQTFDSNGIEYYIMASRRLIKTLNGEEMKTNRGTLRGSIEMLDEDVFNIYHDGNPQEALRLQKFMQNLDERVYDLRKNKGHDSYNVLKTMIQLMVKINKFLINDPMMKFITGAHALLDRIEEWNQIAVKKEDRMINEKDQLIKIIKSWRGIELESWKSSLHWVKRNYIDKTLCDLWFHIRNAFANPIACATNLLRENSGDETFEISKETEEYLYIAFAMFIKNFLEDATLGDHRLRLDLVYSNIIELRFHEEFNARISPAKLDKTTIHVDTGKLINFAFNIYKQYSTLFRKVDEHLRSEEKEFMDNLNTEIKIVSWQNRKILEVKNAFRISHRKLNSIMTKYLHTLQKPISSTGLSSSIDPRRRARAVASTNHELLEQQSSSDALGITMGSIDFLIQETKSDLANGNRCAVKLNRDIINLRTLNGTIFAKISEKYVDNLSDLELTQKSTSQEIENFYEHDVQKVVISSKDSKEDKSEKEKLCRQMYHSKKFALQNVFKTLRSLGLSHQRGLNQSEALDSHCLSLESMKGLLRKKPNSILESIGKLISNHDISSCDTKFQHLISFNMCLQAQSRHEDLTTDQLSRIRGYSVDLIILLIKHSNSPARIYKHLLDIQASTKTLDRLKEDSIENGQTVIYEFKSVYNIIETFNNHVNRSLTLLSKLRDLADCCSHALKPKSINQDTQSNGGDLVLGNSINDDEQNALSLLMSDIHESKSLMTIQQLDHFQMKFDETLKSVSQMNDKLKDMLLNEKEHHIFNNKDVEDLEKMYHDFVEILGNIVPSSDDNNVNSSPDTCLGSILECIHRTKTEMDSKFNSIRIRISNYDNGDVYLEKRVMRLVKLIKLATQDLYNLEFEDVSDDSQLLPNMNRNQAKPFNVVDTLNIEKSLRLNDISEAFKKVILTLNYHKFDDECSVVNEIIQTLAPVLSIYVQTMTAYLNIMYSSIKVKLDTAYTVIPFFTDLGANGLGLPYKVDDKQDGGDASSSGAAKMSEENAGFGEGGQGETDASKKIEFESQLDELDKNTNGLDRDEEEDQNVNAHDDAIEMTDDIGGEARGPDDQQQQQQNRDANDDNTDNASDSDEEELKGLDKEMGSVDQDEEKLDDKLWDDEDEDDVNVSDDDERDLKDFASQNKIEENKLQAKDETLAKSSDQKSKVDETDKQDLNEQSVEDDNDTNGVEDQNEEKGEERDESVDAYDDAMDIMTEENGSADSEQQDYQQQQLDHDGTNDKNNVDDPTVEEGELEGLEEDMEMSDDAPENIADGLCFEDVEDDVHLSDVDEAQKDSANQNKIDETTKLQAKNQTSSKSSPIEPNADKDKPGSNEKSEAVIPSCDYIRGSYAVFDEDSNDPFDDADSGLPEKIQQQQQIQPPSGSLKDQLANKELDNGESQKNQLVQDMDVDSDNPVNETNENEDEQQQKSKQDDHDREDMLDKDRPPSKRTPITGNNETLPKRQKLDKAIESGDRNDDHEPSKTHDESQNNSKFRHVPTAKEDDYEIVDLCSTDDEEEIIMDLEEENQDILILDKRLVERKQLAPFDVNNPENLTQIWYASLNNANHLVHELCQQLQIVLQPTKMSKYKGDYKSGKRLNMRKIIAYVASNYRKDKIWMRKTKPSKRTYSICLAVDNSSSMSENNCRQMTYESLALLAKSLSIIEAGSLNVISFGEKVNTIHDFDEAYHDSVGPKWLAGLPFNETKTSYVELLRHACEKFSKRAQASQSMGNLASQLLILISDGRNMTNEETEIKLLLKKLRSMKVVTLFVIIDDMQRNGGKSITEIKKPLGYNSATVQMVNYMEVFPFPYYVLLRKLDNMPAILGGVLRQWFEAVVQDH